MAWLVAGFAVVSPQDPKTALPLRPRTLYRGSCLGRLAGLLDVGSRTMTIRSKLLILLLVIAVIPLLAITVFDLFTARRLADRMADQRRDLLIKDTKELLLTTLEGYGRVLDRDRLILEHALAIQAGKAEKLLGHPDPPDEPLFFNTDYASRERWPEDTRPSTMHFRKDADGLDQPIPISVSQQVVYLAPGVDADRPDVRDKLHRLSAMPWIYRQLRDTDPEMFYWQYTALEEGIHTSYPGHGGYPDDYDPRQRAWYHQAKAAG